MTGEKLIKLNEIECKEIVEIIKESTIIVAKFRNVINKHLEYKKLESPQIYIVRSNTREYKDDGKTDTYGYKYDVYWIFPYINVTESVNFNRFKDFESYMWPPYLLFFKMTITERINDHKYKSGRFFELYLIGEQQDHFHEVKKVACYNDNYQLSSMLSVKNIRFCIEKINEICDRLIFNQVLLEDLCEEINIFNIEEYIDENCNV